MSCFSKAVQNTTSLSNEIPPSHSSVPPTSRNPPKCVRGRAQKAFSISKSGPFASSRRQRFPLPRSSSFWCRNAEAKHKRRGGGRKGGLFRSASPPSACLFEDVRIPPSRLRTKGQGIQQRWVGISTGGKTISTSLNREIGNKVGMAECQLTYLPLTCFTAKNPASLGLLSRVGDFCTKRRVVFVVLLPGAPWPAAQ